MILRSDCNFDSYDWRSRGHLKVRLCIDDSDQKSEQGLRQQTARLLETLKYLESRPALAIPTVLRSNLELLTTHFSFSEVESQILALAVCLRVDDDLYAAAGLKGDCVNTPGEIAAVLGLPESAVSKALEPSSRLRRSNLLHLSSGSSLSNNLQLRRGSLRRLAVKRLKHIQEMMEGFVTVPPAPTLRPEHFAHLQPSLVTLQTVLAKALKVRRQGMNILLYGRPGTGKTELVRVLAEQLSIRLYEVADTGEDGQILSHQERLAGLSASQFLLGNVEALLCFDEVESLFTDGSDLFGKPSSAALQKSFMNHMLEKNPKPTFWIANSIYGIDPAFVRRFDLVIRLDSPPYAQRLDLLRQQCKQHASPLYLERLARLDQVTPAQVTRAAQVVSDAGLTERFSSEQLLTTVLEATLRAQGCDTSMQRLQDPAVMDFDPAYSNASQCLNKLAEGLSRYGSGRVCLYGPPGTGKTSFGPWLAAQLGRPLISRRISDIQSRYLGEMERNLADAFSCARREGAVLQIDEVDSFIGDRRHAQHAWEVSQVNEFLTQLELFDGVFIASTNLMDTLDQAAMRRFDFKIRLDYLHDDQAQALLNSHLDRWSLASSRDDLLGAASLTPGDFVVIARRHRIQPFDSAAEVVAALRNEAHAREPMHRTIGFLK